MRRKSRTSCWSNPRRDVGNAGVGDRRRRRRVGPRERDGHGDQRRCATVAALVSVGNRTSVRGVERVAAEALQRGQRLVEGRHRDDLDVVAGDLTGRRRGLSPLRRRARGSGATPAWRTADAFCAQAADRRRPCRRGRSCRSPRRRRRRAGRPAVSSSISVSVNASPALGPPISPGVDVDLERQLHRPACRTGTNPMIAARRVAGSSDQLDVDGHGLGAVGLDAVDGDRRRCRRAPCRRAPRSGRRRCGSACRRPSTIVSPSSSPRRRARTRRSARRRPRQHSSCSTCTGPGTISAS